MHMPKERKKIDIYVETLGSTLQSSWISPSLVIGALNLDFSKVEAIKSGS